MEHNLARYAKFYSCGCTKIFGVMNSQGKLITVEEIFLNIGKKMLKTSYALNLG
jgi:phage terminase large subunit-like protein